jgi:hypothetical protein
VTAGARRASANETASTEAGIRNLAVEAGANPARAAEVAHQAAVAVADFSAACVSANFTAGRMADALREVEALADEIIDKAGREESE